MEKNMAGGLQAIHFVKAFVISALITAVMLLFCAFLLLKTGSRIRCWVLFWQGSMRWPYLRGVCISGKRRGIRSFCGG